jgi:hypothetical protein
LVEKRLEFRASVDFLGWPVLGAVRRIGGSDIGEVERRDHRGISNGLEVHVAAVIGALQLDDDEASCPVDCQQVDAPASVFPVAVLLGHDEQVIAQRRDVVS